MKRHKIFLVFALFAMLFSGCKYDFILPEEVPVVNPGGEPVSFVTQIAPIFSASNKCTQCHKSGGIASPDLSNTSTVYSLIVPAYVNTASPSASKIYVNASSGNHNNVKVTASQAALILQWITEGAKNN